MKSLSQHLNESLNESSSKLNYLIAIQNAKANFDKAKSILDKAEIEYSTDNYSKTSGEIFVSRENNDKAKKLMKSNHIELSSNGGGAED